MLKGKNEYSSIKTDTSKLNRDNSSLTIVSLPSKELSDYNFLCCIKNYLDMSKMYLIAVYILPGEKYKKL